MCRSLPCECLRLMIDHINRTSLRKKSVGVDKVRRRCTHHSEPICVSPITGSSVEQFCRQSHHLPPNHVHTGQTTTKRTLQLPRCARPNSDAPILGIAREMRSGRVPKGTETNTSVFRSIRHQVNFRKSNGFCRSGYVIGFSATNNVRAGG